MKKRFHNGIKKSKKDQRKNKQNTIPKQNTNITKENSDQLQKNNNFNKNKRKFEPIKKNSEENKINNKLKENKFKENKLENKSENKKFKKEYRKSAIEQPKECYLRGKLVTKEELRSLNTILKSDNINLDELVNLLESLFERIFDNKNNEPITLREKTGLIEESLKIFELKKSKKYILLRLKVLELLIEIKEITFIPLSLEIVKIIEEILNHEPCLENKHITGYKINEEKWSEEINNQMFKKILRLAYKYFNKYSNCLGFIDLVFYFKNKFKECENEEIKGLIKVIGLHKEYLEKNCESNTFLKMEEIK